MDPHFKNVKVSKKKQTRSGLIFINRIYNIFIDNHLKFTL